MKRKVIVAFALVFMVSSCELNGNNPCAEEKPEAALIHNFPDTLKVGTTYNVDVRFVLENSCGKFDRFEVTNIDKSFDVKLWTKYEGCNCSLQFIETSVNFELNLDFPGFYKFNFWKGQGENGAQYDTYSVKIVE